MNKKLVSLLVATAMVGSMFAGCGAAPSTATSTPADGAASTATSAPAAIDLNGVELTVCTTFAGNDGNAQNFKDAVAAFEAETGVKVIDTSATANEDFKTMVNADFEAGSEPDVLFFFNGADANTFIEAGKVVSIDDIRAVYPDYASNMKDSMINASLVDGKKYAVPVNGFWEAMFVNTTVLDAAGVAVPGADYTWDAFVADCEKIKAAGKTPVAVALGEIPHYWWEFCIFNHTSPATHLTVPTSVEEDQGKAWVAGINDIKAMYEAGYLPENTNTAKDADAFQLFMDDKAAFLIDGSWKVGGIVQACQTDAENPETLDTAKLDKFTVTFVPSVGGERKTTDLIGGISMGYYVTQKAWADEAHREAAVKFVSFLTEDARVAQFAQHTASALKNAPEVDPAQFNSLQIKAMDMMAQATSLTGAVQDIFNGPCRVSTFDGMDDIVVGKVAVEDAVAEGLEIYAEGLAE